MMEGQQHGIDDLEAAFAYGFPSLDSQEFQNILNGDEETMNFNENVLPSMIKQEMHHQYNQAQLALLPVQLEKQHHHQQAQEQQQPLQLPPELQHLTRTPNLYPIPSLYGFEVMVPPDANVVFNQPKLYIKMNSKMTIDCAYIQQDPNEKLFVRAMIIFSSPAEMHMPVKRCANHRIQNQFSETPSKDANILKVNDPKATYHGDENGETFGDRLSVRVPLESTEKEDDGKIHQTIGLEFGCQNSCSSGINRKPTSIVFTLERLDGKLVGNSAIEFKVCSCPKRDADRDKGEKKRKSGSNGPFPRGKMPKLQPFQLKTEPEESESDSTNENVNNADQNVAGATTAVTVTVPTDMVSEVLKFTYNIIAGKMAEDAKRPVNYETLEKCLKDVKKQRKEAAKKTA